MPSIKQVLKVKINRSGLTFITAFKPTFSIPSSPDAIFIYCYIWDILWSCPLSTAIVLCCRNRVVIIVHNKIWNLILDVLFPFNLGITALWAPSHGLMSIFSHSSLRELRPGRLPLLSVRFPAHHSRVGNFLLFAGIRNAVG